MRDPLLVSINEESLDLKKGIIDKISYKRLANEFVEDWNVSWLYMKNKGKAKLGH